MATLRQRATLFTLLEIFQTNRALELPALSGEFESGKRLHNGAFQAYAVRWRPVGRVVHEGAPTPAPRERVNCPVACDNRRGGVVAPKPLRVDVETKNEEHYDEENRYCYYHHLAVHHRPPRRGRTPSSQRNGRRHTLNPKVGALQLLIWMGSATLRAQVRLCVVTCDAIQPVWRQVS